jgi:uncharacterized iron-regulated membrane protein
MWWVRRPKEKTGFPHRPKDFKPAKWLILTICALGVVTPAMGLSLLLILLGDWVVRRYRGLPKIEIFAILIDPKDDHAR